MSEQDIERIPLALAVRVYPTFKSKKERDSREGRPWKVPDAILVLDAETRTDETQRLTFGSYRYYVKGRCIEEGIFYGDNLPAKDLETLRQYLLTHTAEVSNNGDQQLRLLTRQEFIERFYRFAYKGRCLVVGFNLPFDISRIAFGFSEARGRFAGGFSLEVFSYFDGEGSELQNPHRPRIAFKHIDSKRCLKGFTGSLNPDRVDKIPEGSETGEPEEGFKFRGHFLDLRTLVFSLTDRGHTLEQACQAFEVEHGKQRAARHGEVSEDYIDYNRRDVLATYELTLKLLEEYAQHPIFLQPTKAYSPASIGKSYLKGMGIDPIMKRQPEFPKRFLGHAATSFFGGRTSAHIRKTPVPVVYVDFLSMYPTVNSLMGLWQVVIAGKIEVIENCAAEIEAFLKTIDSDALFRPATWRKLVGFVKIVPDGDILPSRAKYCGSSNDYQVAVNRLFTTGETKGGLWYSLADVAASVLLTGKVPKIIDGFRLKPLGKAPGMKAIKLRGEIEVDPSSQDFFKTVIEERKRLNSRTDLSEVDRARLDKFLKVLANATSYGIYAEMNRIESDEKVEVVCYGIDDTPFTCRIAHPEEPGEFCFPPLAALITGGARLMLALLESCIAEMAGTHAMEDTDSMAIVANKRGGLVPCPGGTYRTQDGKDAVKALTWDDVAKIQKRFESLNPYNKRIVSEMVLKIEKDNFNPKTGKQRQLYCYAISAKRYALFLKDRDGAPILLRKGENNHQDRWSEHGLGHLLNPIDLESEDRKWIGQAWLAMIRRALGLTAEPLTFAKMPAVGRVTVSSPAVMRALADFNAGKAYRNQIKPFNFLHSVQVRRFGHPTDADPERFHLITPYQPDPRKWLKVDWIDQYSGARYRITTEGSYGTDDIARVKTVGETLGEYEFHPEAKCADSEGRVCDQTTVGLLQRREVHFNMIRYIGKESNHLEEVDAGLVHSEQSVYTEYPDERRDEWTTVIVPSLRNVPIAELVRESGMSRSALFDVLAGKSRPHPRNQQALKAALSKLQRTVEKTDELRSHVGRR